MSTHVGEYSKMLEEDDLAPADHHLLDMLNEGRITAPYAASESESEYSKQYLRERLGRFVEHDIAIKVYTGLYQLENDPRDEGDDR